MKTICIYCPCRYTRNVIHSLCHDYANKGVLSDNKVKLLSFSDASVFNFFISTANRENLEKVILVNSNNARIIPGMLKLLHQYGLNDICLIAGERYRNITESHMWAPAPQFIDIDEGLDLVPRTAAGICEVDRAPGKSERREGATLTEPVRNPGPELLFRGAGDAPDTAEAVDVGQTGIVLQAQGTAEDRGVFPDAVCVAVWHDRTAVDAKTGR